MMKSVYFVFFVVGKCDINSLLSIMFIASRTRRFIEANVLFSLLVLGTGVLVFIGGYTLFAQAELSNPGLSLPDNWKAWYIIGCYAALVGSFEI